MYKQSDTARLRPVLMVMIIFISGLLSAQDHRKEGDAAWQKGRYKTAVNKYGKVKSLNADKKLLAKRGLGFYKLNNVAEAIDHFTLSKKLGNNDPDLFHLMAQCKQHMGEYDEAAYFYKTFVKERGEKHPDAKLASREMKNCLYAAMNKRQDASGQIQNLGPDVNTYYDEVHVVQSPKYGNVYYYSSNRNLSDMEILGVRIDEKGAWHDIEDFGEDLNGNGDQYVMDISRDGKCLLFSTQANEANTQRIYVSTYDDNETHHLIRVPDYIVDGAVDLQLVDHNTIAFASRDLGGYGGYDIFTMDYQNSVWSDPSNEGPEINTAYDERSPHMATSGEYLYFSSNKPYCHGGYDIYYYNKLSINQKPYNMGRPINSTGNDLHFRLNPDGAVALMSSDRKSGYGAYDAYMVYLTLPKPMPEWEGHSLDYVEDYFRKNQPIASAREKVETKKTHLEEMKDKLNLDEPQEEVIADENPDPATTMDPQAPEEVDVPSDEHIAEVEPQAEPPVDPVVSEMTEADTGSKAEPDSSGANETELVTEETGPIPAAPETEPSADPTPAALPEATPTDSPLADIQEVAEHMAASTEVTALSGEEMKNVLLYQDRHDLMNGVNKSKMEKLITLLKENGEYTVHVIAHTDHLEPGLPEFMQYNTLKRANLIARHLMESGVGRDRISLESLAENFPYAKPEVSGQLNESYLAYNKRIEFEILNKDGFVVSGPDLKQTDVPGYALDRRYELFQLLREEPYYSVEIAESEHIFKNAVLRLYNDIYIRKDTPTSNNKYYIGLFNKYEEALRLRDELNDSSAPYAKIKVFYQGQPVQESHLSTLAKDYPDLDKFIAGKE